MSINTISSQGAGSAGSAAALAEQAISGPESEQRFLKLLVTQLNNQDPLNPMENAELTSQLAQMSTVSGIEKLNAAMQSLVNQSGAGQVLQAASMIGRIVLAPGEELAGGGGPAPYGVSLPSAADSVKVHITDESGQVVRSLDLGALTRGVHERVWDGKNTAGEAVAEGLYRMEVVAMAGATRLDTTSLAFAKVDSVAQDGGDVWLDLSSGDRIAVADVRSVR